MLDTENRLATNPAHCSLSLVRRGRRQPMQDGKGRAATEELIAEVWLRQTHLAGWLQ
jgi:hypothetical protein